MSLELYFIRHGHRADQLEDYAGGPDPDLSPRGHRQAYYVGEAARRLRFDAIFSSSMHRALQTAGPVYERLKVPWHVWPALGETAIGVWNAMRDLQEQGHSYEEIARMRQPKGEYIPDASAPDEKLAAMYPGIQYSQPFDWLDAWGHQPLALEDQARAFARAEQVADAIKKQGLGQYNRVALIGHGNFGSVMMSVLLGLDPTPYNRFSQDNAAISRLDVRGDGSVVLRFLNDVSHLPFELTEKRMGENHG